jgi:hypothetical protein
MAEGVVIDDLENYLNFDHYYLSIFRPYWDIDRSNQLVKECMTELGVKYGYLQIAWLWFLNAFRLTDKPFFEIKMPGIICSELIAIGMKEVGDYPFNKIPACVEPKDIAEKLTLIV